jgi:GH25 family lysozyme M1 (1,4-beta-N-acetylmuramidase)
MATPNRKVLDLSHHNEISSMAEIVGAGIIGIIHKASEGIGCPDESYAGRRDEAKAVGLLWGAYHFATGSDVEGQVDDFLSRVGIDDETLYALDWEDNPGGTKMSLEQAREFLELVEERTGRKAVLYSGNTVKEALGDRVDEYFGEHRLWLAQYSSDPEPQASWGEWWLWQYSDGNNGPQPRGCPGVSGDVDTNSFDDADEDLIEQWSGFGEDDRPARDVPTVTLHVSSDKPVKLDVVLEGDNVTMADDDE